MASRSLHQEDTWGGYASWPRPSLPPLSSESALRFQLFDIAHSIEECWDSSPVIRMFGCTAEGNSVLARIHSFLPYFYIPMPEAWSNRPAEFRRYYNSKLKESPEGKRHLRERDHDLLLDVAIEMHSSIYGYTSSHVPFLKLTLSNPSLLRCLANILERDEIASYERNIPYVLRFMIDRSISGCNWIECPAGEYQMARQKESTCQIEVDICFTKLVSHPSNEGVYASIAPVRIFSFDIECAGRKGVFPEPQHDPIIQIANIVKQQGEKQPFVRNVFSYGKCSPIAATHVLNFETEREMLLAWRKFVLVTDPDMMTGFNIENFDFYFLIERAKVLGLNEFKMFGRILNTPVSIKKSVFSGVATCKKTSVAVEISGRTVMDVLKVVQNTRNFPSYSLPVVCANVLGRPLEYLSQETISSLWGNGKSDSQHIARYCTNNAAVTLEILELMQTLTNDIEMARVTGVPLHYLYSRGQQIKVLSMLLREAHLHSYLIPDHVKVCEIPFTGSYVSEPVKGLYRDSIALLEFDMLYPSIIIANNMCYSTLLPSPASPPSCGQIQTSRSYFACRESKIGILPRIIQDLLADRSKTSDDMAKETDPFRKQVLNGRLIALEISANSIYGFTGATAGKLPCPAITSSVSVYGREIIKATVESLKAKFCTANGCQQNVNILYADTSMLMVQFGIGLKKEEVAEISREAIEHLSSLWTFPYRLECFAVFSRLLICGVSRFAALKCRLDTLESEELIIRGLVSARRNLCPFVNTLAKSSIRLILDEKVEDAIVLVQKSFSQVLLQEVSISELVCHMSLSRLKDDSQNSTLKRDNSMCHSSAERVQASYVVIESHKDRKDFLYEDPIYAIENDLPFDAMYYIQNQCAPVLKRVFDCVLPDVNILFEGKHMKRIRKSISATSPLSAFFVKQKKCPSCERNVITESETICGECQPLRKEKSKVVRSALEQFQKKLIDLEEVCYTCQGDAYDKIILCRNDNCQVLYERIATKKNIPLQQNRLRDIKMSLDC